MRSRREAEPLDGHDGVHAALMATDIPLQGRRVGIADERTHSTAGTYRSFEEQVPAVLSTAFNHASLSTTWAGDRHVFTRSQGSPISPELCCGFIGSKCAVLTSPDQL